MNTAVQESDYIDPFEVLVFLKLGRTAVTQAGLALRTLAAHLQKTEVSYLTDLRRVIADPHFPHFLGKPPSLAASGPTRPLINDLEPSGLTPSKKKKSAGHCFMKNIHDESLDVFNHY